jgi:hypothetical protein
MREIGECVVIMRNVGNRVIRAEDADVVEDVNEEGIAKEEKRM